MCKWLATYHWKDLDKGYNFVSDLISIEGLHAKLCSLKVVKVPALAISGLPYVGLGERHIIYYKGEGGGFPQVWVVVSLVNPSLPVVRPSTKNVPTIH